MATTETILLYFFLFVSIYLEIFILTTFISRRKDIKKESLICVDSLSCYPSITIIVPCFNEEKTVVRTLDSLLALEYPKDKLKILAVDDGSTDGTWKIISNYHKKHPNIEILHKENGGKFTALNYGIEHSTSDLISCLDADSFLDPKTLKKLVRKLIEDSEVMAVTPAIRISEPSTIVQMIQSSEYVLGIFVKKIMSFLGALYVTPGPFTVFRREVFQKIGLFRHAHNTEDMEIAMRMQTHHMKIDNVHNAWVYTTGPNTLKKLYRQRLRWIHGFFENAIDYKHIFLNREYGNLGLLAFPTAVMLTVSVIATVFFLLYHTTIRIWNQIVEFRAIGFNHFHFGFNWFYISTKINTLLGVMLIVLVFTLLLISRDMVEGKKGISKSMIAFFIIYPFISPFWVLKSVYNTIFSKKTSWR